MRKESFIQHTPYLSAMAVAMGYSLDASFEEGERWGRVTLNPSDDGPCLRLDLDTVIDSTRLSWSTFLPTDRWGYVQRAYNNQSSAGGTFDPDKNTPERAAARIMAALKDYAPHHAAHVQECRRIEAAYDRQQAVAQTMLDSLPGAEQYNMGEKPNHNGEAPITISAPGKYASTRVGHSGRIDLSIGSVTPEQACAILRILWAE